MFSNLRRPVPSTAALHVLRQLAYISSGTICGAAALVAEERRRRTRLAKKIVDNSRRLKQHPRYARPAGKKSISPLPGHEESQHEHYSGRRRPIQGSEDANIPSGQLRHGVGKDDYLPSAVEEHYEKLERRGIDRTIPQEEEKLHEQKKEDKKHALIEEAKQHEPKEGEKQREQKEEEAGEKGRDSFRPSQPPDGNPDPRRIRARMAANIQPSTSDMLYRRRRADLSSDTRETARPPVYHSPRSPRFIPTFRGMQGHQPYMNPGEGQRDDSVNILDETHPDFKTRLQKLALQCLKNKDYHTLFSLCLRHGAHLDLPQDAYPALYNTCATTGRLDAAKALIINTAEPLSDSVLTACQRPWALLLIAQWNGTRNLTGVSDLFAKMMNAAGIGGLNQAVYNAMIQACVRARQFAEGEKYLRQMQDRDGLQPNFTTVGHFALWAAKLRVWAAVENIMSKLYENACDTAPSDRIKAFNAVLKEYVHHHQEAQVWSFVSAAVEKYQLVPDAMTNNIVLGCFARHKRTDLVLPWLNYMRKCGFEAELDADAAVSMLRAYYYDMRPSHGRLLWQVKRIEEGAPHLLSPKFQLLLEDAIAYDLQSLRSGTNTQQLRDSARRRLAMVDDLFSDYGLETLKIEAHILLHLSLGQPSEAVALYRRSLPRSGLPQSTTALETAVYASLRAHQGNPAEAEELMSSAHDAGLSVFAGMTPAMLNRLQTAPRLRQHTLLNTALLTFYHKMYENGTPIRHHLVTTAAHRMMEEGQSARAIKLLKRIYNSQWASTPETAFDLAALNVFLQSYIVSDTLDGIEWVVTTVLERGLRIDHAFILTLKRARTHFKLASQVPGKECLQAIFEKVTELLDLCKTRQDEQIDESSAFGLRLVRCIIQASSRLKPQPNADRGGDDELAGESETRHVSSDIQALLDLKPGPNPDPEGDGPRPGVIKVRYVDTDRDSVVRTVVTDKSKVRVCDTDRKIKKVRFVATTTRTGISLV